MKKRTGRATSPRNKFFTLGPDIAQNMLVFATHIQTGNNTDLAFKRAGQLVQLDIRDGMPVKAGQILATLNDTDAKLRVRDRQTALQLTERQFQRFHTLAQRSAVSQSEMDVQRANRDTALKMMKEKLQFLTLRAPLDGVSARVQARNHQRTAAGRPHCCCQCG